jgi:hypothetical protein
MDMVQNGHESSSQLVAPTIWKSILSKKWDQQEPMPSYFLF